MIIQNSTKTQRNKLKQNNFDPICSIKVSKLTLSLSLWLRLMSNKKKNVIKLCVAVCVFVCLRLSVQICESNERTTTVSR